MKVILAVAFACLVAFAHGSTIEMVNEASRQFGCVLGEPCRDGKVCAGTTRRTQCVRPMALFGRCKVDPFWVCAKGLECRSGTCLPPMGVEGERCDKPGAACMPGLVCAGSPSVKKCVKPMPEGGKCEIDPWWICAEGLVCRDFVCRAPMGGVGSRCDRPGVVCAPGTVCAGNSDAKKCVRPIKEGGSCNTNPFRVCGAGLKCRNRKCVKISEKDPRIRCDRPGVVCPKGTICVGNKVKRCITPMKEGMECRNDPFWMCAAGLECVKRTCVKATGLAPPGGRCEEKECPAGEVCAGIAVKRCIVPMGPGKECRNDPFWICEEGLFCKDNVCTFMVEEGGDCLKMGAMCVEGAKCVGTSTRKKCKKPMVLGGVCNKLDPFWFCDVGLECSGGTCVRA